MATTTTPSPYILSGIQPYYNEADPVEQRSLLGQGSGKFTANFADFRQQPGFNWPGSYIDDDQTAGERGPLVDFFNGEGINSRYPDPENFGIGTVTLLGVKIPLISGLLHTNPPDTERSSSETGIFHFRESTRNEFEDKGIISKQIDDFTIFNDYIHYIPFEEKADTDEGTDTPVFPGVSEGGEIGLEVRIPFVSDLTPTDKVWDRYGSEGSILDYIGKLNEDEE